MGMKWVTGLFSLLLLVSLMSSFSGVSANGSREYREIDLYFSDGTISTEEPRGEGDPLLLPPSSGSTTKLGHYESRPLEKPIRLTDEMVFSIWAGTTLPYHGGILEGAKEAVFG